MAVTRHYLIWSSQWWPYSETWELTRARMILSDVEDFEHSSGVVPPWIVSIGKISTFHGYSLWLFTSSDLKTIVGPSLIFGVANALSGATYGLKDPEQPTWNNVIGRLPLILLWIWINLLPFTINNQKSPAAVKEDEINKPWRTLPSQRMTSQQAERLMLTLYPIAVSLSFLIGGLKQSIGLVILGTWYNNFAGGDASCVMRNLINASGYVCFTSGAMEVALSYSLPLERLLVQWFIMIAAIIFTTVHIQDMYDQPGDSMRGRRTLPLVIGDTPARWTIAIPMLFWGYVCPWFWNGGVAMLISSLMLACIVAARTLLSTTVDSDRLTFKFWNCWMALIFVLPLMSKGSSLP